MTLNTWLLYVGTVLLFMSTPGPSHMLMLSTSMTNGFHRSLLTAAGDLTANAIQMVLAGLGLGAAIIASGYGFAVIKWLGVAYLVWLGIRQIRASMKGNDVELKASVVSLRRLWLRGFVTSAANPKAIVFFAALFPQFLDPDRPLAAQLFILGATYLVLDGLFLAFYGKSARWLSRRLKAKYHACVERLSGAGLIFAAVLLGLRTTSKA